MIDEKSIHNLLIIPPIFKGLPVWGFFTTRAVNGDLQTISSLTNVPASHIYHPIQKHTDLIIVLGDGMERKVADAVITAKTNILIGVDVADCVPILLYDRRLNVAGVVHAGWRGTTSMILKKTLARMSEEFGSSPLDILTAMGPAIGGCCYEVGANVIEMVEKVTGSGKYYEKKAEKYFLDLPTANMYQAVSSGVPPDNIWLSDNCTFCLPERFFSYRYEKGKTGRQSGYIGALEQKKM